MASAFEKFLRTGRRAGPTVALEAKFNPWHDPEDGRFTFAGQGRYFAGRTSLQSTARISGIRGRGGGFGGGGAGGSWEPSSKPAPTIRRPAPTRVPRIATGAGRAVGSSKEPRKTIPRNGFDFSIDAHARPRQISGELKLQLQQRSRRAQVDAGKPDRRTTDDGGHYIAARFNGPREWFNHFAQDASFTRGAYRTLEDDWAKAIRSGKRVFVDIVPHYHGTSMRPHRLDVTWIIDGQRYFREFPNERQGR